MLLPLRCLRQHCARSGLASLQTGRPLALGGRGFAEFPIPGEWVNDDDEDIVLKTFREQQQSFRHVMDHIPHIYVPMDGNPAGIRKYMQEMEALKKEAGLPEVEDVVEATLDQKMKVSQGDIRKFLASAAEDVDLGEYGHVLEKITAAVGEAEASSGGALTVENEQGWSAFQTRVQAILKEAGLTDYEKAKDDYLMDMYTRQITEAREAAEEGMESLKRREGLEGISISAADIKW